MNKHKAIFLILPWRVCCRKWYHQYSKCFGLDIYIWNSVSVVTYNTVCPCRYTNLFCDPNPKHWFKIRSPKFFFIVSYNFNDTKITKKCDINNRKKTSSWINIYIDKHRWIFRWSLKSIAISWLVFSVILFCIFLLFRYFLSIGTFLYYLLISVCFHV